MFKLYRPSAPLPELLESNDVIKGNIILIFLKVTMSEYLLFAVISHPTTLFVKGHIPDIMEFVFYCPVPAYENKQFFG